MLVTYYVIQGSSWINIGLTPITENYYNCSRQKQIPIFTIIAPGKSKFLSFYYNCSRQKQIPIFLRKHIKIEPLRWYYHCDQLGMLVWQDMVNGGEKYNLFTIGILPFLGIKLDDGPKNYRKFGRLDPRGRESYYRELAGMVDLLYNTVSINVWVPFNEGWGQFDALKAVEFIRKRDTTRLIDHASGWHDQGGGDFKSPHVYFVKFKMPWDKNRAVVLSEFGGYSYQVKGHVFDESRVFGYRKFKNRESYVKAFQKLYREQIIPCISRGLSATVYTQLSDVEDEVNGLFTYDREVLKLTASELAEINDRLKLE